MKHKPAGVAMLACGAFMAALCGATHALYSIRGFCLAIASVEPQCLTGYASSGSLTAPLAGTEFLLAALGLLAAGALLAMQVSLKLNAQGADATHTHTGSG